MERMGGSLLAGCFIFFHHLSEIQLKGLLAGTHRITRIESGGTLRYLEKLVWKETVTIPAGAEFATLEFYRRDPVKTSPRFDEVILKKAPQRIVRGEHRLDIFKSSESIQGSGMLRELGSLKLVSVNDYLASMKVRLEMLWTLKNGHGLDDIEANVEFVDVGDCIVIARCHYSKETEDEREHWYFNCRRIDESGYWEKGICVSAAAI